MNYFTTIYSGLVHGLVLVHEPGVGHPFALNQTFQLIFTVFCFLCIQYNTSTPTKQLQQVCKIQHSLTKFVSFPLIKTLRYLCICTKAYQPYWHSSGGVIKQQGLENEVTLCSHRPPPCPLPLLFPVLINAVSASPFYLIWSEWTSTEGRYAHSVLVFTLFSLTYNDWWFHSSGGEKKKKKGYHRSQRIPVRTTIPLSDQGSAVWALFTICESPQLSSSGILI